MSPENAGKPLRGTDTAPDPIRNRQHSQIEHCPLPRTPWTPAVSPSCLELMAVEHRHSHTQGREWQHIPKDQHPRQGLHSTDTSSDMLLVLRTLLAT